MYIFTWKANMKWTKMYTKPPNKGLWRDLINPPLAYNIFILFLNNILNKIKLWLCILKYITYKVRNFD